MTNCCNVKTEEVQINQKFNHLLGKHPCFSARAHFKYGRIHLPVSPTCNIQCRFCKRCINKIENRPGVAAIVLTPKEAVKIVAKALELCPEISVVGIAGPGETLATDNALETFEMLNTKYPHLIKCLSTNGLMLDKYSERIIKSGVQTVSVTVNAVEPEILQYICSGIFWMGSYLEGYEGAEKLIQEQIKGIEKLSSKGIAVKVNTVLIPDLNYEHIEEIARVVSNAGASIINIIPLIPQHEMKGFRPPDCNELNDAREWAGKYLNVFRHCRQCRADACGIPGKGKELGNLLYDFPMETFSHG
ncbi:radical SAM protein [Ruminiclostridium josui]|uniref:radical SAM protein n=1 Tax=Ruminiclostridium josui TaxID=1499 RepID=UPI000463FEC8|nr:radical SAM protein [Ruminiclostridium josui]